MKTSFKHKTSLFVVLFFLIAICYLLFPSPPAFAQSFSLEVNPPILQINANPPATFSAAFSVQNPTDTVQNLSIKLTPFHQSPNQDGQIQFNPNSSYFGGSDPNISDKLQILDDKTPITSLVLTPGEQKNLALHLDIAQDEPPSDYYFTILFTSKSIINDQNTTSGISGSIGVNVLLSIGPQGQTTGFLQEFSSPWLVTEGPIPFSVLVENTSNFFIVPKGIITIKNLFGQTVGKVNLVPVNILSKSSRFIPDTSFTSLTQAVWPEKVLFGPYNATLTLALSDNGPLFTKTVHFFALPYSAIIIIIIISLVAGVITLRVRERLKKQKR